MNQQIVYTRPTLAPYQISSVFNESRYAEIEASTKSGKTHTCLAWLFEQAAIHGAPGRNYWWVAPVYPQAAIAYRRLKLAIPVELRECNESTLSITISNGARIWFKSAEKPDNLYGEDVYAAVLDEASRCREESWYALRSTLTSTQGKIRMIGNVKGRRNWFYLMCRKAQAGEPDHTYSKITAADAVLAGIINKDEVEDARRTLPEAVFNELFNAEASDDGGNPFGLDAIRACVKPKMSILPPAAFGVDLAKSVDWTVIIGLDRFGDTCRYERFQAPWTDTIRRVRAVAGSVPTFVDSTGVGDPVLEHLQQAPIDSIPWTHRTGFQGYKFSSESKQRLMEGLAVAIQQKRISFPEGVIVDELEAYEYEYTRTGVRYTGPEGTHDDTVCALALAVSALTHALLPRKAITVH